jgi:hypothetical protein
MDAADCDNDVDDDGARHPVDILAEEYADRLRRGETPSITEYEKKYGENLIANGERLRDLSTNRSTIDTSSSR